MVGGIILESERLLLREITADDLDDLLEIWGDPEAMRFFPRTLDRQAMGERRYSGEVISASFTLSNDSGKEELAEDTISDEGVTSAEDAAILKKNAFFE